MKICRKCGGDPKPLDEFHLNKNSLDGHNNVCKVCARAAATNQARMNSYWTQRGKEIARQRKETEKNQRVQNNSIK